MGLSASKAALGATTEEPTEPERKHLSSLVKYINGTNMNAERPFNILLEKTGNCNWVVVFKALITVHHLMIHGNERFIRHVASRNSLFTLHNFLDKGVPEGPTMSTFIRRYSRYLNEKSLVYRLIAYDITKSKRGTDGVMRTMNTKKLLNILPVIQTQFDALLNFNASPNEITNGIVRAAFMLLFKDCLRLFAAYNEGILNLLGKYFDMRKNQCNQSLDIYIAFLARTTRLAQFLKVAEEVGIHQSNIPYLTQKLDMSEFDGDGTIASAPHSLIEALKQHLASLEDKNDILPPYSIHLSHSSQRVQLWKFQQAEFCFQIISAPCYVALSSQVHKSVGGSQQGETSRARNSDDSLAGLAESLNFGESPVNETGMNQHQVSEKEMIDGMTWQLNTCTCTSSIWDSISAPNMVQTPMGSPSLMAYQPMVYTQQGLNSSSLSISFSGSQGERLVEPL